MWYVRTYVLVKHRGTHLRLRLFTTNPRVVRENHHPNTHECQNPGVSATAPPFTQLHTSAHAQNTRAISRGAYPTHHTTASDHGSEQQQQQQQPAAAASSSSSMENIENIENVENIETAASKTNGWLPGSSAI